MRVTIVEPNALKSHGRGSATAFGLFSRVQSELATRAPLDKPRELRLNANLFHGTDIDLVLATL
jgi:hypothetical protein